MAITIIMIVATTLLLWLVVGGIAGVLIAPLLKEKDSRTHPSREKKNTRDQSPTTVS